jgi:two-component system, NtrC family, sensor kinase
MAGSLVVPALLLAIFSFVSYRSTLSEASERLERAARITEEVAARVAETNDVIWGFVDSATRPLTNQQVAERQRNLHEDLRNLTSRLQQIQSVWIWDESGRPLASSVLPVPPATLSVADRAYFRWAMTTRGGDWFISEPLLSRITGEPFFDFSRRRETPDGRFLGAVSVSLFPGYFTSFFAELAGREPGLALALLRPDGVVIAQSPETAWGAVLESTSPLLAAMRAGSSAGETEGVSSSDSETRLAAYRQVGRLPLYVSAALDEASLFAPWRRNTMTLVAVSLPIALALALLSWIALLRARGEEAAVEAYREQSEQRLRAEQALRQAQKLEALGRVTGGVAHDFNNLLMVIQNSTALARKLSELGQSGVASLAAIERAVATGTKLTRQLLAFSRRQPLQAEPVAVGELFDALLPLIRTSVGSQVSLDSSVAPATGWVHVDRAELELAILNLCLNAKDAMPDGGRLSVHARALAADSRATDEAQRRARVVVEVADTGTGMTADVRERVFEPFFTTKPIGRGTGLGLTQVFGFAQQAGGTVVIDSTPGLGTKVAITLPAYLGPVAPVREDDAPLPALSGRLLLVEDNDDMAASLAPLLEHMGLEVDRCGDAAQALQRIEAPSASIDVVLSDIEMPGSMDGIALAATLQQRRPDLPVLLMTGYTAHLDKALSAGLIVLAKPCTPAVLGGALAAALGRAAAAVPPPQP